MAERNGIGGANMLRKSLDEIRVQAMTWLQNNQTGEVSPGELRTLFLDFFDAIAPAHATLALAGPNNQELGQVPVKLQWSNAETSNANEITTSAATGSIIRAERGTTKLSFTIDFACAVGRAVTFTVYRNGLNTQWSATGTGNGDHNLVSVSLTGIDYADPAPDYYVMATCSVNGTTVALSNGSLVASIQPVNSYV